MRIISGLAKGRKILSPNGYDVTRPTLDRVKEAMFSIIQNRIYDSTVLDLFAGTGSLGLEAVSRGARKCFLVDRDSDTFSSLEKNVEDLKFLPMCSTMNMDSYKALEKLGMEGKKFNIIFIDPPYKKDMIPPAVEMIEKENLLELDGIIVTKIDTSEKMYKGTGKMVLTGHRKYGKTTLCFYGYKED